MEMQMPRPGPEHEVLKRFTGDWTGEETMFPAPWHPEQRTTRGRTVCKMLDGFFAVSDYVQHSGKEVSFQGHGVYSWDPAAREYVMYWFDSMGGAGGVARGTLDGDVLTFETTSPMGRHRYRYTLGAEEMVFEMAIRPEGADWHEMMRGVYRPTQGR